MLFIILGIVLFIVAFVVLSIEKDGYDYKFKPKKKSLFAIPLLLVCILGCVKSVPTGHTGIVTTFGKVENYTLESGVHFINPFSRVIKIDNRTQKATAELSAFSSDIQEVSVNYTINYCIDKKNAQNLYKTVGLSYLDTVISPKVIEDVKTVMAKYTAENLVSSRTEVAQAIEELLSRDLAKYNIQVVATSIENLDFTDAFTDAVEAKQVAEQNKLKTQTEAETQVIKAKAEADVKLIEAEATAQANDLLTESLTDDILNKLAIEKWDGVLPTYVTDGSPLLGLSGLQN